jgi:hypothetical protein
MAAASSLETGAFFVPDEQPVRDKISSKNVKDNKNTGVFFQFIEMPPRIKIKCEGTINHRILRTPLSEGEPGERMIEYLQDSNLRAFFPEVNELLDDLPAYLLAAVIGGTIYQGQYYFTSIIFFVTMFSPTWRRYK